VILANLALAAIPAASLGFAMLFAPDGAAGVFQAAVGGLVAAVALGGFSAQGRALTVLARLGAAAVLAGLLHLVLQGDLAAALALGFLFLAASVAAAGLAALGGRLGTPAVPAGAIAACVLWTAMAGLFWADPLAEHLDLRERRPFRQAVLHVDPALALAYDGARFDRLRSPEVYFDVPLASSVYERPAAGPTGAVWLVTGLVLWGGAALAGRLARRRGAASTTGRPAS
jgi:hypothetical protein